MGLLPHVPPCSVSPFMSSHQDPYHYSGSNPICDDDSGLDPPVVGQHFSTEQSWSQTAAIGGQSGYAQTHQSSDDQVGNLLRAHDVEDMNYPGPSYSLPSTSSQNPGAGTDAMHATYTNDNVLYPSLVNLLYPFPEIYHGHSHSQHQSGHTPYNSVHYATQPLIPDAHQHLAQGIHNPQTSQDSFAHVYSYLSSTQFPSPSHDTPVYRTDTRAARLAPESLTLDGVNTARTDADVGQHSHPFPVVAPSNQISPPGPSHLPPSSPERKRLLPSPVAGEHTTARRVMPRHDGAQDVHSISSESPRRSSNSHVYGRGPLIPQERYTTSTISSYNTAEQHSSITFDLENPDQIGIPIIDIINKSDSFARMRNRTETFSQEGKKTFSLRIQWPGYRSWSKTIAAMDWKKSRGPITRVKLAEAVATAVRDLFEKYRDKQYDPDYAEWNVGPNGIQLDQVCLVALHHVSKGSWQPQLCLLRPQS